jgi:hypothetical protein
MPAYRNSSFEVRISSIVPLFTPNHLLTLSRRNYDCKIMLKVEKSRPIRLVGPPLLARLRQIHQLGRRLVLVHSDNPNKPPLPLLLGVVQVRQASSVVPQRTHLDNNRRHSAEPITRLVEVLLVRLVNPPSQLSNQVLSVVVLVLSVGVRARLVLLRSPLLPLALEHSPRSLQRLVLSVCLFCQFQNKGQFH